MLLYGEKHGENKRNVPQSLLSVCATCSKVSQPEKQANLRKASQYRLQYLKD